MDAKITRRTFIIKSGGIGAAAFLGSGLLPAAGDIIPEDPAPAPIRQTSSAPAGRPADIAVVTGEKKQEMTRKAVEMVGGMKRFVPRGARVCVLPNSQRSHPGTFTDPDIVRAVIGMCREAGAREVSCLSWLPRTSWEETGLGEAVEASGGSLMIVDMKDESLFRPVPVPDGKALKEARIMKLFFEHDVLINVPITKDHAGNRFTGTLKNLMGLNSPKSNRTFHTGNFTNDDIEHLDQSIADLNTVVAPALCVVDATEFIITNGPFGPGKLHRPRKVVAGTDRVAVDAYCAALWGLAPREIIMIDRAHKHGLGEIDPAGLAVAEAAVTG